MLAEAFRVLKPGGRFAVSDVVVRGEVPADVRRSMELWVGCVAGALEEAEFHALLARGGLRRTRHRADARLQDARMRGSSSTESGLDTANLAAMEGKIMAAFVRATKPVAAMKIEAQSCCGPTCCS